MPASVLVVDDDPNLVRLMSKFLMLEGFAPVPAANGAEALKYLRGGGRANVILLDLRMPVMDGWEFCRRQGADPRFAEIPVAIVTASASIDAPMRARDAGLFVKPVNYARLLALVERLRN
jgi:two-component system, NtrC family, response regulator GlrR